jgi:hypothetical protein
MHHTPDLDRFVESRTDNLRHFRSDWQNVWLMADAVYIASKNLIGSFLRVSSATAIHRLMMWQTVLGYLMQSFALAVDKQLDESMALLRMAAELARDMARLGERPELIDLWLSRRSEKVDRKKVRDSFRFDENDATEKQLRSLYDLASSYGIHGHLTTAMSLEPTGKSEDGEVLALQVGEPDVHGQLTIWFTAFMTVQFVCIKSFHNEKTHDSSHAVQLFLRLSNQVDTFLKEYQSIVREMRQARH